MSTDLFPERKVPGISCPQGPAQILRVINATQGSYDPEAFLASRKVTSGKSLTRTLTWTPCPTFVYLPLTSFFVLLLP